TASVSADLWTLSYSGSSAPRQYVNPSTAAQPEPAQDTLASFDFKSGVNLSYSYQFQHDRNQPILGTSDDPTFPAAAETNPHIQQPSGGTQPGKLNINSAPASILRILRSSGDGVANLRIDQARGFWADPRVPYRDAELNGMLDLYDSDGDGVPDKRLNAGPWEPFDAPGPWDRWLAANQQSAQANPNSRMSGEKSTDDELRRKLNTALPQASFQNQTLESIINTIRDATGANIVVKWAPLSAAEVEKHTKVNL